MQVIEPDGTGILRNRILLIKQNSKMYTSFIILLVFT